MKSRILKSINRVALVFVLTLAGAAFLTQGVKAQTPEGQEEQEKSNSQAGRLEGTWRVKVTIRVCQTGAEIFTFPALVTFAQGGTMTETSADSSPAVRGPGHGVWQHTGGRTYRALFEAFTYDAAGRWTGTQRITSPTRLGHDSDNFNATASLEIFDTDGTLIFMGCSTAVGRRME